MGAWCWTCAPQGNTRLDTLPGAVSFPLFTDEERARVGTAYKQESKQEAVDLGLELVGPKLRDMAARARALFEAQETRTPLLVHCWRGGMRSGSVDWLLRTAEVPRRVATGATRRAGQCSVRRSKPPARTWCLEA